MGLHACTVDGDLVAHGLGLERFGEHQLAHPVDALVAALSGEVVHLPVGHDLLLLAHGGDELELKGAGVGHDFLFLAGAQLERSQLSRQLVRRERRAGDSIVVDIDCLQCARRG